MFAGIGVFLAVYIQFIHFGNHSNVAEALVVGGQRCICAQDVVVGPFERMEFFSRRLETFIEVTPTAAMADIITKIMVEVLTIFGIATEEITRRRGSEPLFSYDLYLD